MNDKPKQNRRSNVLSQPRSQLRIMFVFALLAIVYSLLNVYISKHAFNAMANDALTLAQTKSIAHDLQVLVQDNRETLDLQLGVFSFLSFFMLCLAGVLISHRIGGPIFHIINYMNGVMSGKTVPRHIGFRKGDFFHDLAEAFNRFQVHEGLLKANDDEAGVSKP